MRLPFARLAALLVVTAAAASCATNPVTGGQDVVLMSEAQEIEMGRQEHAKIMQQFGRYDDEALQAYVSQIGQRIVAASHRPNLQYTFTVLDSPEVNAFALPGYVYITRGIMVTRSATSRRDTRFASRREPRRRASVRRSSASSPAAATSPTSRTWPARRS
jgi:predicted Zn-dependent protease